MTFEVLHCFLTWCPPTPLGQEKSLHPPPPGRPRRDLASKKPSVNVYGNNMDVGRRFSGGPTRPIQQWELGISEDPESSGREDPMGNRVGKDG